MEDKKETLLQFLGAEIEYDEEKKMCFVECQVSDWMMNALGMVHGGIYTYFADTAMGHLALHFKQHPYVSLELKTTFLKSTKEGQLYARARFLKEGHRILFLECQVENELGEVLCMTSGTFYRLDKG